MNWIGLGKEEQPRQILVPVLPAKMPARKFFWEGVEFQVKPSVL